jgi:hypothetical protein
METRTIPNRTPKREASEVRCDFRSIYDNLAASHGPFTPVEARIARLIAKHLSEEASDAVRNAEDALRLLTMFVALNPDMCKAPPKVIHETRWIGYRSDQPSPSDAGPSTETDRTPERHACEVRCDFRAIYDNLAASHRPFTPFAAGMARLIARLLSDEAGDAVRHAQAALRLTEFLAKLSDKEPKKVIHTVSWLEPEPYPPGRAPGRE